MSWRNLRRAGFTLVEILVVGGVIVVVFVGVINSVTCSGTCATVACTESAPCTFGGKQYVDGKVCAAGVEGTVCEKHWFAADCKCITAIGPGGIPTAGCKK